VRRLPRFVATIIHHYHERRRKHADQPSEKEEEYFARQMFETKQKVEQEKQQNLAEAERQMAKELHFMKCPSAA